MDQVLHLTLGLPGQGMHLGIDPLSALFLCLLAPQVSASAMVSEWRSAGFWIFVLGMVLTLLAADAFTLILGFELMSAASWLLVLEGEQQAGTRGASTVYGGVALFSGACLMPALFLPPGDLAFVLVLLGAGAKAGLAPLHFWLPRAHPCPSAGVSAVMSGGMVKVALYVLIRYAFLVDGAAVQPWWGVALAAAGAASVLLGGLRALLEVELKTVLACSTVEHVGLIAVGLGVALLARAEDNAPLAVLALESALLFALAHALFKPLLFLGAGVLKASTGTTSLNWLGGLARGMPRLSGLMLVGALGLAAVPFAPGFPAEFLLLHAVMAGAGGGGVLPGSGFTALLAILGLCAALALAGAVRLFGIGFLGRPRTLRAAAAEEADRQTLLGMSLLAVLCLPIAFFPVLVLRAIWPVILQLIPGALPLPLPYAPVRLAMLLLLPVGLAFLALRRWGVAGEREAAPWNGGFGSPPAWLPFGDPLTQPSASGFAEPVARVLGVPLLGAALRDPGERYLLAPLARINNRLIRGAERVRRATLRQRLAFVFAVLVGFLLVLGVQGG